MTKSINISVKEPLSEQLTDHLILEKYKKLLEYQQRPVGMRQARRTRYQHEPLAT